MDVISLQSGSSGNCIFVRSGDTRLLIDAGISGRQAELRLAQFGHNIRDVDAVILTHEHSDHICGLGVFHRKFGLPVYANMRTWNAARAKPATGCIGSPNHFVTGKSFTLGNLRIQSYRTPHDAIESVCFVVEDLQTGQRFGLLTDLGHVFSGLQEIVLSVDALLIESNYDDDMLHGGPYPQQLKDRITGKRGHISNVDAAQLLSACCGTQLQWACLGHLSGENNSPDVALATHRELLGDRLNLFCADRAGPLQLPTIEEPRFALQSTLSSA